MKLSTHHVILCLTPALCLVLFAQAAGDSNAERTTSASLGARVEALEKQVAELKAVAYKPTLGEFMTSVQMRHAKLWLAGEAQNWKLAAFELHELDETLEDLTKLYPTHKDAPQPLSRMITELLEPFLKQVEKVVQAGDGVRFATAFDALSTACNTCHTATVHGYVSVKRPSSSQFGNQDFAAPRENK